MKAYFKNLKICTPARYRCLDASSQRRITRACAICSASDKLLFFFLRLCSYNLQGCLQLGIIIKSSNAKSKKHRGRGECASHVHVSQEAIDVMQKYSPRTIIRIEFYPFAWHCDHPSPKMRLGSHSHDQQAGEGFLPRARSQPSLLTHERGVGRPSEWQSPNHVYLCWNQKVECALHSTQGIK